MEFKDLPKPAWEFNCFLNLIIEDTIGKLPDTFTPTYIRCHKKGCHGSISSKVDVAEEMIQWKCSICPTSGSITHIFEEPAK